MKIKAICFAAFAVFLISTASSLSGFSSKMGSSVYIDSFDFQTEQYFYSVRNAVDDENEVINICLYNIKNNSVNYVFPYNNKEEIINFYYQIGYKTDEGRMLMFPRDSVSQYRALPPAVDTQKASRNMIIVTYSKSSKMKTLWLCSKDGSGLKKLAEFGSDTRFEIDTMYNKILLIKQEGNKLKIDPYNY
ncbi:MAG: hypothetical protein KAZ87_06320 [Spirochaetes bacterium]|nr:hypothetical protein [Spirochaetota bacterium]